MPQIIDIEELPTLPDKRYAIAWLDKPLEDYGKIVLVGLWTIMTIDVSSHSLHSIDTTNRPFIGLNLTRAKATLGDLFAEDVRTFPLKRPSGKTDPTSVFNMVDVQVRAMLKRDPYLDDDREWYDTISQIVRSMSPARHKVMAAERDLIYEGNLSNHRIPREDEEALFEIAGLEPNEWTGSFVENLIPLKSKWRRW